MVATFENQPAHLLVNTYSNINIITSEFLSKLNNYMKMRFCSCKIRQVAVDRKHKKNLLVQLPITIGNITIPLNFRIIENIYTF